MAYILSKVGQSFNVPVHTYKADTKEDMNTIDLQGVPVGSKCYIINNGKWYMLNSERKWKAMSISSGGGSSGYATINEIMQANGYTTGSQNITEDQIIGFKAMLNDVVTQIQVESGYSTNQEIVPYFNDAENKIAFVIQ